MIRILFLLLASLFSTAAIALDSDREQPAVVDAQDIEIDLSAGLWTYRGDVTIRQGTLYMQAEEIQLFFEEDALTRAVANGTPAIFEQQPEGGNHLLKGRAQNIEIDEIKNIAIFVGNAKLQQGRDVITGETIIYDMETEKITVRGNASALGQTRRLLVSDIDQEEDPNKDEISRPKVVIQSSSNNTSVQNSIGSIEKTADEITRGQDDDAPNVQKKLILDKPSIKFLAARVKKGGARVHAAPITSASLLGNLSEQTPLKVLEIRNDLARVTIPSGINVWVSDSYVRENAGGQTIIKGKGVRARWLPSIESHIVGIFEPQEQVRVLGEKDNWKQVVLPPSIPAWIPLQQIEILEELSLAWYNDWKAYTGAPSGGIEN